MLSATATLRSVEQVDVETALLSKRVGNNSRVNSLQVPRSVRYFLTGVILCLSGCGGTAISSHTVAARTMKPYRTPGLVGVARRITLVDRAWERAFGSERWEDIRRSFAADSAAAELITQMKLWRAGQVRVLHIVPTYVLPIGGDRFVATMRFSSDPRAVPAYRIYIVALAGASVRVAGTTTGIAGTSFSSVRWSVTRSQHFVVFHSPYEVQGSDRQYLADLEYQRTQIAQDFGISLPARASYYLYPDTSLMARLTLRTCGANPDNVGCTNPYTEPPSIQTSVWPTYHEPVHVDELALEPPPTKRAELVAPLFIAEGTAVALQDRTADPRLSDYCSTLIYVPLDACARVGISQTRPLDLLTDRGFKRSNPGNAYALSGSFVKFLILRFGYKPFGHFYYTLAAQPTDTVRDYNVATAAVFHSTITALLQCWQRSLCRRGCT